MADPALDDGLEPLVAHVRDRLLQLGDAAGDIAGSVAPALAEAGSLEEFQRVQRSLEELAAVAESVGAEIHEGIAQAVQLRQEWEAAHRYTAVGLKALAVELDALSRRPHAAARRWLDEILDAIRASELDAAVAIAGLPLDLGELCTGFDPIRSLVKRVNEGDTTSGLELTELLAGGDVPGWERVLDPAVRARAHRLATVFAVRQANDIELATEHANQAVETDPQNGVNHAERANVALFTGDLDRAAADAEQAIELSPDDPSGYLSLGLWAELTADFDEAERLYGEALRRMTTYAVMTMRRRLSLLDPPGLLLLVGARQLLAADRWEAAQETAAAASLEGVRGRSAHPDADAYRVRHEALEELDRDAEAAVAALEAGRRYHWSGDSTTGAEELRAATELDASLQEAWWMLADTLVVLSFPGGMPAPDQDLVDEALELWDHAFATFGAPVGEMSWAYLTRAAAFDLRSRGPAGSMHLWEAVLEIERALVHELAEGRRWGFAAKFLRSLALDQLAFEAVERAHELSPNDDLVLQERMALLSNRGRFGEAAEMGRQFIESYGEDPWLVGVQGWLALHEGRFDEALRLLDLSVREGYNLSWYRDLRALAYVGLDDVEGAREEYREILAGVESGEIATDEASVRCTVAISEAVAGSLDRARKLFAEIPEHEVTATDDMSYVAVQAFLALAGDELERGVELLRAAVGVTRSDRDLDDLAASVARRLLAVPGDAGQSRRRQEAVRTVMESSGGHRDALASAAPTVESELLETTAAEHDNPVALTALAAIEARRSVLANDADGAASRYERLIESHFEPEASIALTRTLKRVSDTATARGDAEETRRAQRKLVELGGADPVDATLAVAASLQAAGNLAGARDQLELAAALARGTGNEYAVAQALGDLCLLESDWTGAVVHFDHALVTARDSGNAPAVPRLETRAALASLLSDDQAASEWHLAAAIRAWREAGAYDPLGATVQEARAAVGAAASSEPLRQASESLAAMVDALAEGESPAG